MGQLTGWRRDLTCKAMRVVLVERVNGPRRRVSRESEPVYRYNDAAVELLTAAGRDTASPRRTRWSTSPGAGISTASAASFQLKGMGSPTNLDPFFVGMSSRGTGCTGAGRGGLSGSEWRVGGH